MPARRMPPPRKRSRRPARPPYRQRQRQRDPSHAPDARGTCHARCHACRAGAGRHRRCGHAGAAGRDAAAAAGQARAAGIRAAGRGAGFGGNQGAQVLLPDIIGHAEKMAGTRDDTLACKVLRAEVKALRAADTYDALSRADKSAVFAWRQGFLTDDKHSLLSQTQQRLAKFRKYVSRAETRNALNEARQDPARSTAATARLVANNVQRAFAQEVAAAGDGQVRLAGGRHQARPDGPGRAGQAHAHRDRRAQGPAADTQRRGEIQPRPVWRGAHRGPARRHPRALVGRQREQAPAGVYAGRQCDGGHCRAPAPGHRRIGGEGGRQAAAAAGAADRYATQPCHAGNMGTRCGHAPAHRNRRGNGLQQRHAPRPQHPRAGQGQAGRHDRRQHARVPEELHGRAQRRQRHDVHRRRRAGRQYRRADAQPGEPRQAVQGRVRADPGVRCPGFRCALRCVQHRDHRARRRNLHRPPAPGCRTARRRPDGRLHDTDRCGRKQLLGRRRHFGQRHPVRAGAHQPDRCGCASPPSARTTAAP